MAKILFVDDDPITLELMGRAASLLGHEPILARSGEQAIKTAQSDRPRLIFMDMMMPDMGGVDVLKLLTQKPETADIPVVILSAGASLDDAMRCEKAGAKAYLSKPVPLQTLMDTIKKYSSPE
jgi:CheY-like chemotaxis protein